MDDPQKNPHAIANPRRVAALQETGLLDTPAEPYFDRVTRLVRKLIGAETSLLSLVTPDRQFFKSSCGFTGAAATARETPLSHSFCKYVVESGEPYMVRDARKMPELSGHPAVDDFGVVSYLGVPVHAPNGHVIGSLCVLNGTAREWSLDDLTTLKDLAAVIDEDLALRARAKRSDQLAQENGVLAREYHHRVKNALAISAALVKLSGSDATSVEDLVTKARDRLIALSDAHDQLMSQADAVDLKELSSRLLLPYCPPGSVADVDGPSVSLANHQITPVCFFLHELATNSAKYGAFRTNRRVTLRWSNTDDLVKMDWNEQLTDASQRSPKGFGSRLIETAAHQLGGSTNTTWSEDGLNVSLDFPIVSHG